MDKLREQFLEIVQVDDDGMFFIFIDGSTRSPIFEDELDLYNWFLDQE